MSKSESGRIVLEVDPNLKKTLYSVLALEQKSLKDWFISAAKQHIKNKKLELLKSIEQDNNEV